MTARPRFWRWVLSFGILGVIIPLLLLARWHVDHVSFGDLGLVLWPASFSFTALDSSDHFSTIAMLYGEAFLANFALYALIGGLFWPVAHVVVRLRDRLNKSARPSA